MSNVIFKNAVVRGSWSRAATSQFKAYIQFQLYVFKNQLKYWWNVILIHIHFPLKKIIIIIKSCTCTQSVLVNVPEKNWNIRDAKHPEDLRENRLWEQKNQTQRIIDAPAFQGRNVKCQTLHCFMLQLLCCNTPIRHNKPYFVSDLFTDTWYGC